MEELKELVDTERLSENAAQKLKTLTPQTFCAHKSWGFGQVKAWDIKNEQIIIDFVGKKGHALQLEFAADSLTPVPDDHIQAKKMTDLNGLKKEAAEDHKSIMICMIQSLGNQATGENMERMLCPDVVSKDAWKKWWDAARKALKKEGNFEIPTNKKSPFKILPKNTKDEFSVGDLSEIKGVVSLLKVAENLLENIDKVKNKSEEIKPVIEQVETALRRPALSYKKEVLKLAIARDELAEKAGLTPSEDTSTVKLVVRYDEDVGQALTEMPASDATRLLFAIKEAEPQTWGSAILRFLSTANARLAGVIGNFFESQKQAEMFRDALKRGVREQSLSSDVMIWIFKNRKDETQFLVEPRLFNALISAIERDQMGDRKSARLRDLVLSDKTLLTDLVEGADLDAVRDLTRGLMLTAVFDEMDQRSLLARIIKKYPEMQTLVSASSDRSRSGADAKQDEVSDPSSEGTLIVSWESLEKRNAELDDLISKKIPANTQEIATARSYGDLRENAEFKFAKEQQTVLARRRAELERDLMRTQGTDFSSVDTTQIGVGCHVTIDCSGREETFVILGAWDTDPDKKIISYLTPMAKALQNKRVGDSVSIPDESGNTRKVVIKSISAHNSQPKK